MYLHHLITYVLFFICSNTVQCITIVMYVLFTVYVAFIGGVAMYIDHTHDRLMHACFSITVYCPTGCVMAIKN